MAKPIYEQNYTSPVTEDAIYPTGLIDSTEYITALDVHGNLLWQTPFGTGWHTSFNASTKLDGHI